MRFRLALLALVACDSAGGGFGWTVVFEGDLGTTAVAVDLSIVPGGCVSVEPAVYTASVGRSGMSMRPDALEPGTYGFRASARNENCEVYAEGCVEATFEEGVDPMDVVTSLSAVTPTALCPAAECVDGTCQGVMPDGGMDVSMDVDVPVDAACDPDLRMCAGDDLQTCVDGRVETTPCDLGCGGTPADCQVLIPSNVGEAVAFDAGDGEVTIGEAIWLFDTATGEIRELADNDDPGTEVRAAGEGADEATGIAFQTLPAMGDAPAMGVFVMASLSVPSGRTLAGTGANSLVLLVNGDVDVAGTVHVAASSAIARTSPGGAAGAPNTPSGDGMPGEGPGAGTGGGNNNPDGGGGGGGLGSAGADGAGMVPGVGGAVVGNISLVPLVAGSGGGGGGSPGGAGGRGAGALQISARGSVSIGGTINACGEGGRGGQVRTEMDMMTGEITTFTGGGGGGGSGGAVLIEGLAVSVDGLIAANGGGGGQGSFADDSQVDGADGDPLTVPAPATGGNNAGGAGSDETGAAGVGMANGEGGGGGGGAGRIRINTPLGVESFANTSPNSASGLTTVGPVERG